MTKFTSACLLAGIFLMLFIVVATTTANTDQKALQLLREADRELKLRKAQIEQLQKENQTQTLKQGQKEQVQKPNIFLEITLFLAIIGVILATSITLWKYKEDVYRMPILTQTGMAFGILFLIIVLFKFLQFTGAIY